MLISVTLKSSVDHVGDCFCLSVSSSLMANAGQASPPSTVPLGQYSVTVQRSVVLFAYLQPDTLRCDVYSI